MKETTPYQLNALKGKQDTQKQLSFASSIESAVATIAQEHVPAMGRARSKNPRLPHQKHEGDTSYPPLITWGKLLIVALRKRGI